MTLLHSRHWRNPRLNYFGPAFAIGLICASVFAQENTSVRLPPYSKLQLKNGMTVLLMEQHEVPIISFSILLKAGSVADPTGKEGLASLTADLLRKGTRNRTADQLSSDLDFIGGEFDMNTSTDFTSGSAEFLKKDIHQGLDLLADVVLHPVFPPDEVEKLVQQRVDGIKSAKDRAESVIGRYFFSYLYGRHLYGRPVGGDERSLATITPQDVQRFYDAHYGPANMILAAAGDFTSSEMGPLIEEKFNGWAAKSPVPVNIDEPVLARGKRLLLIDKPDSTQTYFYIGNLGISRTNPDRVAIDVVNSLFGGSYTSKLNTALRIDSGLTYGAYSSFDQHKLAGPFIMSTFTRNATTEKAVDMALEVLSSFHETGVSETDLTSAKAYLKGQFPTSIETTDRLASTIASLEFYGLDESDVNAYYAKIDAVTVADARRIIKTYLPQDNLVLVLIGRAAEIQTVAKKYAPVIDMKTITQPGF